MQSSWSVYDSNIGRFSSGKQSFSVLEMSTFTTRGGARADALATSLYTAAQAHIPQILRAIGMDRILTEYYSWRSQSSDPGAQIDLIIDRADGFLNLCEVKYAKGDYALTKAEAEKIENRVNAFQQETGTNKNILVTLITVKPVKENAWTDTVSSFVSLQDLLG